MNLKDKVFIVTGGSSGLGKEMAIALAEHEAHVIITGRDKTKLNNVAAATDLDAFHADVVNDEDIQNLFDYVMKKYGRLDGLINNAGIGGWLAIDEMNREKMREVFEVNVFGAAMVASHAAKIFKEHKFGALFKLSLVMVCTEWGLVKPLLL